MRILPLLCFLAAGALTSAKEYIVPADTDVSAFFAALPGDASSVRFSDAAVYRASGAIPLPDRALLVVDGAGCTLELGPASPGFTRLVADQQEAMRKVSHRYVFRDFGAIVGGRKAFELHATLGSSITDCRLNGQTEVAVDLRFCLMARATGVLVTNPGNKGFVVAMGEWPGANWNNSQSNGTVLEQCRVFASRSTTVAYTVLNTSGVRMRDCISEGAPVEHDLFLSATTDADESKGARNTVVKTFILENFHVEHRATKASLYINMPPRASVDLASVYWNSPQSTPVIVYVSGQLNLSGIGWWNPDFRIATRVSAPRINVDACNNLLAFNDGKVVQNKAGALELWDPLPENERLSLSHVRRTRPSM